MIQELVKIELTPYEAESFVRFQKHRALVELLESIGAFDVKGGSISIHFSHLGEIVGVDKHEHYNAKGR